MSAIQISVFLENKSGRLAEVTQALAKANVNIRALSLAETIDYGVLRLIVNRPQEASEALTSAGFIVTETDVVAAEMPDRPGALAALVEVLTRQRLNIEYCYAFVAKRGDNAVVIFRVDDAQAALSALEGGGAHVLSGAELSGL